MVILSGPLRTQDRSSALMLFISHSIIILKNTELLITSQRVNAEDYLSRWSAQRDSTGCKYSDENYIERVTENEKGKHVLLPSRHLSCKFLEDSPWNRQSLIAFEDWHLSLRQWEMKGGYKFCILSKVICHGCQVKFERSFIWGN